MSKELVGGVSVGNLIKFMRANTLDAAQVAQGFMKDYSGSNLNPKELLAVQKEFSVYMRILENQEKRSAKEY